MMNDLPRPVGKVHSCLNVLRTEAIEYIAMAFYKEVGVFPDL
jgi:hypothetical protein